MEYEFTFMEGNLKIPVHVSIIMDGNGRWAAGRGRERVYGHSQGAESVRACVEASVEYGVKYLSLFAFSEENWGRPEAEINTLMNLMMKSMSEEIDSFIKNGIRFIVMGNRERLDPEMLSSIDHCMELTAGNDRLTLIVFLSYSGKWDILNAAKKLALHLADHPEDREKVENMQMDEFGTYLVTSGVPDPDLIIRTSGESRISNYLLWQAAYSELLFVDTLWPDFRKEQFRDALVSYSKRDRRYGKVK